MVGVWLLEVSAAGTPLITVDIKLFLAAVRNGNKATQFQSSA